MAEAEAIRKGPGTQAQKQQKLAALQKRHTQAALAVLTPAQRADVQAMNNRMAQDQQRQQAVYKTLTPAQKTKLGQLQKGRRRPGPPPSAPTPAHPAAKAGPDPGPRAFSAGAGNAVLNAKQRATLSGERMRAEDEG
jgi:Spy/CpxP family protein refolding chaperone